MDRRRRFDGTELGRAVLGLALTLALVVAGGCAAGTSGEGGAGVTPDAGEGASEDPDRPPEPDSDCASQPCDLYDQCGCESGAACDLERGAEDPAATVCRAVESPGRAEARCSSSEECARGYTCAGSPGHCRQYCQADGDCDGGHCILRLVRADGEVRAQTCTKPCKPEASSGGGCPEDYGCRVYLASGDGGNDPDLWYTDCSPVAQSGGGHGADCSQNGDLDCAAGYSCLLISYSDGTESRDCRQNCVYAVDGQPGERICAGGRTCESLGVVVDGVEYGGCR